MECLHLQAFIQHIAEEVNCGHITKAVIDLLYESIFEVRSHIADDILNVLLVHASELFHHLGNIYEVEATETCNRNQLTEVLIQFSIAFFIIRTFQIDHILVVETGLASGTGDKIRLGEGVTIFCLPVVLNQTVL